jgi:hypothetical protein
MGFALRKTGEPVKALEMYDKALALAPGFPDALEYRGEAYLASTGLTTPRRPIWTCSRRIATRLRS